MMQKYGVENVNDHFVSFNTICDATQVLILVADFSSLIYCLILAFDHIVILPATLCIN